MTEAERLLVERIKLALAEFEYLRDAFVALSEKWSNSSTIERQPDGVTYLVKARPEPVDPLLRVRVGTFVHHLRATLDNLAWALAVKIKASPGKVSFPIATSLSDFNESAWVRALGQSAACVVAAERLQPYNRPDARCLVILHRLWNHDKHRVATVLPVVPTGGVAIFDHAAVEAQKASGIEPTVKVYRPGKALTDHSNALAQIVMPSPRDLPPKGGVWLRPALEVEGALSDRMLPHALFQMQQFVRDEVMPALRTFL